MSTWYLPLYLCNLLLFFFKQKTAYEMRISDWSSDVCSSDLPRRHGEHHRVPLRRADEVGYPFQQPSSRSAAHGRLQQREDGEGGDPQHDDLAERVERADIHQGHVDDIGAHEIGRASCRARVCQFV